MKKKYIIFLTILMIFILGIVFFEEDKETLNPLSGTSKDEQKNVETSIYRVSNNESKTPNPLSGASKESICYTKVNAKVTGNSMEPRIANGKLLEYYKGYYDCNKVIRDDVVVYKHGYTDHYIKQIKAVPGDKFEYKSPYIFINGEKLKNSIGEYYSIDSPMLKLYSRDYPIIPKNAYLILGDRPEGTDDSSKFGLVGHSSILGKVINY